MKTLAELRKMLGDVVDQMEKLNGVVAGENGEIRSFTKDEQAQYDKLLAERATLKSTIDRMVETEQARAEADKPTKAVPAVTVTRAENHDEKGQYRGFRSLGDQLQSVAAAGKPNGVLDKRLGEVRAASGLNTTVDEDGGFLVQSDFMVEMIKNVYETGQVARDCRQITTSSQANRVEIVTIDEKSRVQGSRYGGVRAYWRDEADRVNASKPKLGLIKIELESLMAIGYATEENLQDAPLLQTLMRDAFVEEMAYELDEAILFGDGAGKPQGVHESASMVTVDKESGQANDTFVFSNASKMFNLFMYPRGLSKANWYINQELLPQLEKMYVPLGSADGLPVYQPAAASQPQTLYGRPIKVIEQARKLGDLGDITLGDFSQYGLVKKGTIDEEQSIHVRFEYAERAFRFITRVGGQSMWKQAVTPANATGSRKVSPFVRLEAR